jgi:hypothetical protein
MSHPDAGYRFHIRAVTTLPGATAIIVDIYNEDEHQMVISPVATWAEVQGVADEWHVPEDRWRIDDDAREVLDA